MLSRTVAVLTAVVVVVGVSAGCNPGETRGSQPTSASSTANTRVKRCRVGYSGTTVHTFSLDGNDRTGTFAIEDMSFDVAAGADGFTIVAHNAAGDSVSQIDTAATTADSVMTVPGLIDRVEVACSSE